GSVQAGAAPNVIPAELTFSGTARFLHEAQGERAVKEFERLLEASCEKNNCTFEYIEEPMLMRLFVYNDETCASIAEGALTRAVGEESLFHYPAWMASEPFSLYQKYFPGVF